MVELPLTEQVTVTIHGIKIGVEFVYHPEHTWGDVGNNMAESIELIQTKIGDQDADDFVDELGLEDAVKSATLIEHKKYLENEEVRYG